LVVSGLAGEHTVGVLRDRPAPVGVCCWLVGVFGVGLVACGLPWSAYLLGVWLGCVSWLGVVVGVGGVVVLVVC
jgi:hypothetical protein